MNDWISNFSIRRQFFIFTAFVCIGLIAVQLAIYFGELEVKGIIAVCLCMIVLTILFANYVGRTNGKRVEMIVAGLHAMSQGDLTHKIHIDGKDEFAWMCWEYSEGRKGFVNLVKEITGSSGQLAAAAEELSAITEQANAGILRQQSEIEQVATAMNEMSATVKEVSNNAANAAAAAQDADDRAKEGL